MAQLTKEENLSIRCYPILYNTIKIEIFRIVSVIFLYYFKLIVKDPIDDI
jgi:hypothetical protein